MEKKKVQNKKKEEVLFGPYKYLGVTVLLIAVVLVVLTLARMFGSTQNIDYSKSYLVDREIVSEISCSDIANATTGSESFIFVTSLNNEEEYSLEKDLRNIIGEYRLNDKFFLYVLNDTCGSLNDTSSELATNLKIPEAITHVPTILYYKDGEFVDYVSRADENMMEAADFVKLLDMYEITK